MNMKFIGFQYVETNLVKGFKLLIQQIRKFEIWKYKMKFECNYNIEL